MILEKYLDDFYLELVYNHYQEEYIIGLDATNFEKVYCLLQEKGFYFIKDIILNYLELFELEPQNIEKSLQKIEQKLGINYIYEIGKNMTILHQVIEDSLDDNEFI